MVSAKNPASGFVKRYRTSLFAAIAVFGLLGWAAVLISPPLLQASGLSGNSGPSGIQQPKRENLAPAWGKKGQIEFGFQFGYGLENNIPHDVSHINMAIAEPQLGVVVWDSPHSRLPFKRVEVIAEGILGSAYRPGGSLLGMNLLFRLGLKPDGKLSPFVDLGSGPLRTTLNKDAEEITGQTQFLSQAGLGVSYHLWSHQAMVFEYRYFHMSNGGLQEPNPGFNGSMLTIGFCWERGPHLPLVAAAPHDFFRLLHLH